MSEENNQAGGAAVAERLRDVPADITEYKKFVAEGGNEHNDRILGREAAEKAALAAGLTLASGEDGEHKPGYFERRIQRLKHESKEKVSERDQKIADLEKRLSAQTNGHAATASAEVEAPAAAKPEADDKTPPRPKEADFKTYSEFVEALTDWKTDRKLEASEAKRNESRRESEAEAAFKVIKAAHDVRVDEAKTRIDDFAEAFDGLPDSV